MRKLTKIGAVIAVMASSQAMAMPTGAVFTKGSGTIAENGKETTISVSGYEGESYGSGNPAVITLNSLNLASDEQITVNCSPYKYGGTPVEPVIALYVLPGNSSQIDGKLLSTTCRIMVINPDGIALGDSAIIDAPGFIAAAANNLSEVGGGEAHYVRMDLTAAPVTSSDHVTYHAIARSYDSGSTPNFGSMEFNVAEGVSAHMPILINPTDRPIAILGLGVVNVPSVFSGDVGLYPSTLTTVTGRILNKGNVFINPLRQQLLNVGRLTFDGQGYATISKPMSISGEFLQKQTNAESIRITIQSSESLNINQPINIERGEITIQNEYCKSLEWLYFPWGEPNMPAYQWYPNCVDFTLESDRPVLNKSVSASGMLELFNVNINSGATVSGNESSRIMNVQNNGTMNFPKGFSLLRSLANTGTVTSSQVSIPGDDVVITNSGLITSQSDNSLLQVDTLINNGEIKAFGAVTPGVQSGTGKITSTNQSAPSYILKSGINLTINNQTGGVINLQKAAVPTTPAAKAATPILVKPSTVRVASKPAMMAVPSSAARQKTTALAQPAPVVVQKSAKTILTR